MAGQLGLSHPRIDQPNDSPLDAAAGKRDFLARLKQAIVDVMPFPKMRLHARLWIGRALGMIEIPQAGKPTRTE